MKDVTEIVMPVDPAITRYRLNLYTDTGTIKQGFSGAVLHDVSRQYGDIMRAISSTRFMTMDEICESVWVIERRMRHPSNRTRKQIELAIAELLARDIITSV